MPFGHRALPSKRYKYGAREPLTNLDLIAEQHRLSHDYGNGLVAIDRERREAVDRVRLEMFPDFAEVTQQLEQLKEDQKAKRQQLKTANAQARRKIRNHPLSTELREIAVQIRNYSDRAKELKAAIRENEELRRRWNELDAEAYTRKRALYAEYREQGLIWGTCLHVEANRLKTVQVEGKPPGPPRFHRWSGKDTHTIAVQIQSNNPLDAAGLLAGTDTRVRLLPGNTGNPKHYILHLRIGSDERRRPIFTEIPLKLHRPIPEDVKITWVFLYKRRIATHWKWDVQFILSKEHWGVDPALAKTGRAVIDLRWRKTPTGLRVVYWRGHDGRRGTFEIPEERLDRWRKVEDLQSIRARNYNDVRGQFREWLRRADVPEWLSERTQTIAHWRSQSQARLAAIVIHWRNNRFSGDTETFDMLEAWRKQDKHLYDWQEFQRKGNRRWRDEFFRQSLRTLRLRYGTLGYEDFKLDELRKTPEPEEERKQVSITYRDVAAVGRLRELTRETGMSRDLSSRNTTARCNLCGEINTVDAELIHTCSGCGERWDVGESATINLLRVWDDADREEREAREQAEE